MSWPLTGGAGSSMGCKLTDESRIMTPEHLSWHGFKQALKGPEGINLRIDGSKARWNCSHHGLRSLTRTILARYKDIDVEATLQIFDELGGRCDCEVVFTVEDTFWKVMGGGEVLLKKLEKGGK